MPQKSPPGSLNEILPGCISDRAGPAGMKAAVVAARRGRQVTLFETEATLGGHLRLYERLPHTSDWSIAIDNLEREIAHAGVDVQSGHAATLAELQKISPDFVAIANQGIYDVTKIVRKILPPHMLPPASGAGAFQFLPE